MTGERWPGAKELLPYAGIHCFDSLNGSEHESHSFRTWETEPPGWFRLSTEAGWQTLLFTAPHHFMRPIILNNVFARPGEKSEHLRLSPRFDFTNCFEGAWDPKPASDYYQPFTATGRSVTSVGFRLASDGVDGAGPRSQNLVVSIVRHGPGTPDAWSQVGPEVVVPDVDSGGPKNYLWCAGWNSGEVPLTPGEPYAVRIRAEKSGGAFQAFWRPSTGAGCYRVGAANTGFQKHDIWLAVATDSDGLVIPYNKRVQKAFGEFGGFACKWSQTYVAQGHSLAAAVLYAAVSGTQPPLSRQRLAVRLRRGGPDGPVCGVEKLAAGNGNYTGDASWGVYGVAFSPGEAPLVPGQTYAVEFESIETAQILHGFLNIKDQFNDERVGFNPYRKQPSDIDRQGKAYRNGKEAMAFSLDIQIIEYANAATNWQDALEGPNLLSNGDMSQFERPETGGPNLPSPAHGQAGYRPVRRSLSSTPRRWKPFALDPQTLHAVMSDPTPSTNGYACVFSGGGQTADGGFVQRVEHLSPQNSYRLTAGVRSTWASDFDHASLVGMDPTGQDANPEATTIIWSRSGGRHGSFAKVLTEPIRPATNVISVWLRARSTWKSDTHAPFMTDFDDISLRQVRTSPPEPL